MLWWHRGRHGQKKNKFSRGFTPLPGPNFLQEKQSVPHNQNTKGPQFFLGEARKPSFAKGSCQSMKMGHMVHIQAGHRVPEDLLGAHYRGLGKLTRKALYS